MDITSPREGVLWHASCVGLVMLIVLLSTFVIIGFLKVKERKTSMLDVAVSHFLVGLAGLLKMISPIYDNSRTIRESLIMNRSFFECISITAVSFSTLLVLMETLNPSINSHFRYSKKPFQNISSLRVFLWLSIIVIGTNMYTAQFLNPSYLGYYLVCIHIIYIIPFVTILILLPIIYARYKTSLLNKDSSGLPMTSSISSEHLLCCLIMMTSLIVCWFPITSFEFAYTYLGKTSYCRHIEPNYVKCLLFGYINSVITPIAIGYAGRSFLSKK